jgi:mitogen-activated protein kinase kinase 3
VNDLRSLFVNECPFLVKFYGAMFDEGTVKVALELMDMGSLKDIIKLAKVDPAWKQGQPLLPEAVVSKITQQVLAGLAYLNICLKQMHRDIKPDNVLCNKDGFVKLTDFGITKQLDSEEQFSGTFVGTMNYMSPERMEGEKYNFEGDIWSLGLVMIELCTGNYPFKEVNNNFLEMLEQVKYEASPSLPKGLYSDELIDFVDKCLQKECTMRPSAISLLAHPFILNHTQTQANLP